MTNTNYKKGQVFICFRGIDERYEVLADLKQKLIDGNINVLTDEDLTGQRLLNIFPYIRNSKVVIVIISENYAGSEWCLKELVEIKTCYETEKLRAVIPIFLNVRVKNVKEQSGKFGEKFLALQNSLLADVVDKKTIDSIKFKIEEWKNALKMIGEIGGVSYNKTSPDPDFLEKILEKVDMNLVRVAAEEGRNNTDPKPIEKSQLNQFNNCTFNVNVYMHHRSKSIDGPILSWNPEGYYEYESIDVQLPSGAIKRSASFLDNKDQLGPFPFEAIRVQEQVRNSSQRNGNIVSDERLDDTNGLNQKSNDNIVPDKPSVPDNPSCHWSLLYCFGLGCILPAEQNR